MEQEKNVKDYEDSNVFLFNDYSFICFTSDVNRITNYSNSDRLTREKKMHKSVAQHINNTGEFLKLEYYTNICFL
jgi:hypothetical protein